MHIMDIMKAMYGIDIDYWKSYKALVHAREMVQGTWESGYSDLPSYLHRIETANPDSKTEPVYHQINTKSRVSSYKQVVLQEDIPQPWKTM